MRGGGLFNLSSASFTESSSSSSAGIGKHIPYSWERFLRDFLTAPPLNGALTLLMEFYSDQFGEMLELIM